MDEDATGADIGLGQVNLDPGTGLDPGTVVRAIPTAATSVFPENSSQITVPLSTTALPRGADQQTIAPQPGQPVNLAAPDPVKETSTLAQAAPVVPPGSIAPQVQTATDKPPEQYGPFGQRIIAAPPGQQTTPGVGQGFLGTTKTMVAPYDRDQNPLITARQNLTAQADALEARARHPYNQMMNHDSAEQWLKDATEMRLKAADIDNKIQAQKDNQAKADNMGVPRANQSMTQTDQSSLEATIKRMRDGDYNAMEALNARGYGAITKAYEGDMLTAMETKLKTGMQVKTLLDSAHSDAAYNSIKNQLETDKNHPLANSGFDIPKTLGEWQTQRAQRDRTGREGLLALDRLKNQQAQQVNFVPVRNKEVAEQQLKTTLSSDGQPMPGLTATQRNGLPGNTDVRGSHNISKYGAPANDPERWEHPLDTEKTGKMLDAAIPKEDRRKMSTLYSVYEALTHDKDGKPLPPGQINTNPQLLQTFSEVMTAEYRLGGGANASMMGLEAKNRGWAQNTFDDVQRSFAALKGVVTGKEGQYLTKLTQEQKRFLLEFTKANYDNVTAKQLTGFAKEIGKSGHLLADSGLDEGFVKNPTLEKAHDFGRDTEKLHMSSLPAVVDGQSKTRTYLSNDPSSRNLPGVTVNPLPPSLLPGLYPELTVNPNAAPPAAPAAQQPPASGVRPPPPAATPPAAGGGTLARAPYNPRLGQYGTPVTPAPAAVTAAPAAPAAPTATGNVFGGGAAPVPFTPGGPPAVPVNAPLPGGGLRPLAATPAASLIQSIAPRAAPPVQTAQANLPASWGVSTANVPAAAPAAPAPQPQRSVPTPQQPGGPGTANVAPPAVVAPAGRSPGGTFNAGVPSSGFPAKIASNPVARTVYGVAGQTAQNVSNNPTIANNSAVVVASSAASESGYRANEIHDGGIGQGLFGHNRERLSAMQQFAGVPVTGKPGAPIPANVQAAFYTREISKAADTDPFIARTLSNPNASAEDLTRVQVRMERPQGYTGPGSEEKASGWSNRLASTRELMGQTASGGDGGGGGASAPAAAVPYPNPKNRDEALANYNAGQRQSPDEAAAYQQRKNELANQATRSGAAMAKPILTTAGAIGGTAVGGPVGGAGGALAGGVAGGALENYLTGENPSDPRSYVVPMAKGAVESIPAMIPGGGALPVAARIATSGAIPAAFKYAETGDAGEAAWAGLMGSGGAAAGEGFGRALGMAGHKLWGGYNAATQKELVGVGQTLSEKPAKVMDTSGKMIDNPLWVNAATRAKELGQDPDALAYAWKTSSTAGGKIPTTKAEAVVARPAAVEAAKVGREFDDIRTQINEAPKPSAANAPTLQHDPTSIVGDGKAVPPEFMKDANTAKGKMLTGSTGQPPKSWGEVWQNQVDARAGLLKKEREAQVMAPSPGKDEAEKAYRAMANVVREQQQHIAEHMLPPDQAKALMDHLKLSDDRYRKAMDAGGPDLAHTIAQGGEKGRQAKAAFDELAQNDVGAQRMMAALVKLHTAKAAGHSVVGTGGLIGSLTLIPGVGHYAATGLGMVKGWQMLLRYSALRGAGSTVKFGDLVKQEMSKNALAQSGRAGAILGAATAQGADNLVSDGASQ